jgi:hypothetical protein
VYIDYLPSRHADVAELVDAQVSEACSRKGVEVRFFSSALIVKNNKALISLANSVKSGLYYFSAKFLKRPKCQIGDKTVQRSNAI